ncbi:hypothetical protein Clacol_004689 [Clathrus columnatus]|uniref:Uncharacterized protein n=1 Tax=Clathrus columnatus TaxID=1419009 RepID=A0AAV5ABB0_9AGAM|nr:hypothetical protein Clacol_004689 [Clathrus columnatus]
MHHNPPLSNPYTKRPRGDDFEDDILVLRRPEGGIPRMYKGFKDMEDELTEDLADVVERSKTMGKEVAVASVLNVLHNFVVDPAAGRALEERLNHSFSQVKFADVAPFFQSLVPHAYGERDAGFTTFRIKPFRLPEQILGDILADLELKFNELGFPHEHDSDAFRQSSRNYWRIFMNRPEATTPSDIRGQLEHRWTAFETICVTFCELKLDEHRGNKKLTFFARMILELDGCAQLNHTSGHCVPIIGIGSSGAQIRVMVYHPHSRRFFLSEAIGGFPLETGTLKLLKAIRHISETFMTLFVCSYINTLDAYMQRSEFQGKREGKRRESTPMWEVALRLAKDALRVGQGASKVMTDQSVEEGFRVSEAEKGAQVAMDLLRESFSKAPKNQKAEQPSLLAEFRDTENRKRLAEDEMWGLS